MASLYVRIILGMPVKDPTSGFVCYKAEKLRQLNLDSIKSNGYSFQIEMKFKFFLKKYILKEIPIIFTDKSERRKKRLQTDPSLHKASSLHRKLIILNIISSGKSNIVTAS
jgi:hypothetical protein